MPEHVFDPSTFEEDITAVEVSGLGRGRGFQVTGSARIAKHRSENEVNHILLKHGMDEVLRYIQ